APRRLSPPDGGAGTGGKPRGRRHRKRGAGARRAVAGPPPSLSARHRDLAPGRPARPRHGPRRHLALRAAAAAGDPRYPALPRPPLRGGDAALEPPPDPGRAAGRGRALRARALAGGRLEGGRALHRGLRGRAAAALPPRAADPGGGAAAPARALARLAPG